MMNDRYLMHYGVKGMKWGVRKQPEYISKTRTKNGETLYLKSNKNGSLARLLGSVSPKIKAEQNKTHNFYSYVNNKKVGSLQMYEESPTSMNIVWGDTKKKYRGRGYMQATLSLGEDFARKQGKTKITAELVGVSPDIHTVAKKANYKKVGEAKSQDLMDVWGGLTLVEKKLK